MQNRKMKCATMGTKLQLFACGQVTLNVTAGTPHCTPRSARSRMESPVGVHALSEAAMLRCFLAVPPDQRRCLALVCKKWHRVASRRGELWEHVKVTLPADFLQRVDVAAMYRWFIARAGAITRLEFEIGSADAWSAICGVVGITGRGLAHIRVSADGEGCYEPGGRAAWMALAPNLASLSLENSADWMISSAVHFPQGLTELELSNCGEEGLPTVPAHLGRLPALVSLSLQGSQLDSRLALEPLRACSRLQRLNLSDCCLQEVPPCLAALAGSLTALTLSCNPQLGGKGSSARLRPLAALTRLQLLEMRDCRLTHVPSSVTGLVELRTLKLAMNCMEAAPGRHFVPPGPYLASLAKLGLSDCFEEDSGMTLPRLAVELAGAAGLEVLRINRNMGLRITPEGLAALLRGKPSLRRLDFSAEMIAPGVDLDTLHALFPTVQLVHNYS